MKKGIWNALSGVVNQLLIVAIGFFVPRMFVLAFGSEVNGLTASITQVFVYFSLFDAGIGAASLQALYRPVAEDDKPAISGILSSAWYHYKRTAWLYLLAVLLLAAAFPLVVQTDLPGITVMALVLSQGLVGIVNYVLFTPYKALLQAEGKEYFILNLDAFVRISVSLIRLLFIVLGFPVVVVQSAYVIMALLQGLIVRAYMLKKYPWVNLHAKPDHHATRQRGSAMVHQISALVFQNTDILIITIFAGLSQVSVYALFAMFFDMANIMVRSISNSVGFALGQTYGTDRARFIKMHDCFEVYFLAFVSAAYAAVYTFILPLLKLYTAGVTDTNYLDPYLPALFLAVSLLSAARIPSNMIINFAGHFKETQRRSMLEAGINLGLSLILVQFFGIYGALLGTVVALLYRSNDIIIYANRKLLQRSPMASYRRCLINLALLAAVLPLSGHMRLPIDGYISFMLFGAAYFAAVFALFVGVHSLVERDARRYFLQIAGRLIRKG